MPFKNLFKQYLKKKKSEETGSEPSSSTTTHTPGNGERADLRWPKAHAPYAQEKPFDDAEPDIDRNRRLWTAQVTETDERHRALHAQEEHLEQSRQFQHQHRSMVANVQTPEPPLWSPEYFAARGDNWLELEQLRQRYRERDEHKRDQGMDR